MEDKNWFEKEELKDIEIIKSAIKCLKKYKKPYEIAEDILKSNGLPFICKKYEKVENTIFELYEKNHRSIEDYFHYLHFGYSCSESIITKEEYAIMSFVFGNYGITLGKKAPFIDEPVDVLTIKRLIEDIGREYADDLVKKFEAYKSNGVSEKVYTDVKTNIKSDDLNIKEEVISSYNSAAEKFYQKPEIWIEKYNLVDNAVSRESHPTKRV